MAQDPSKSEIDRLVIPDDYKKRILDFLEFNLSLPSTAINDEPTRCYRANIEWAKIIEGFLDWLTEIAAWKDAENENYLGIQSVLEFLEGVDCEMPIDCEEVEACLTTSPTISEINDAISGLSGSTSGGYNPANATKPIQNGAYFPSMDTPLNTPDTCDDADKDALWGAVENFIDFVNSRNVAFGSQYYLAPSSSELRSRLINMFPILQAMESTIINGFNDVLEFLILQTYGSIVTNALLNEIKCDLFCDAVGTDCTFDIRQAWDYFIANSLVTFDETQSITDAIQDAIDLATFTPKELFSMLAILQLSAGALGEIFTDAKTTAAYVSAAGATAGTRNWAYLCDECSTPPSAWTVVFDFQGNYSPLTGEIVYRAPFNLQVLGAQATNSSVTQIASGLRFVSPVNNNGVRRTIFCAVPFNIDQVQWKARRIAGFTGAVDFRIQLPGNGSGTGLLGTQFIPTASGAYEESAVLNQNASLTHLGIITQSASGTHAGDLSWVKLVGTGQMPILF